MQSLSRSRPALGAVGRQGVASGNNAPRPVRLGSARPARPVPAPTARRSLEEVQAENAALRPELQGEAAEADALRQQNERLRKALAERLGSLSTEQREAFLREHERIRKAAKGVGEAIPPLPATEPAAPPTAAASEAEVASHSPAEEAAGREHWLFFTVPETPVAGATCVVYFNKAQSPVLRHASRVQLHSKFNAWELEPAEGEWCDMQQEGTIPRGEGTDFYRTQLLVPEEAYEMNFVFGNGGGLYDNNENQNYIKPVSGPMTRELWIETAPERAEAAWIARKEAERLQAKREAAEREEYLKGQDQRRAEEAVEELRREYGRWRGGASSGQPGLWEAVGAVMPGATFTLRYNRLASPLSWLDVPAGQELTLRLGHNCWKRPTEIALSRSSSTPSSTAAGGPEEWWEAQVTLPDDAVVLDWVVQYFDQFDNNGGADYRLAVGLPAGSLEAWLAVLLPTLRGEIYFERKEAEQAEAERQAKRLHARDLAREKAEEVRRRQMRHVLFTLPEEIEAGHEVRVHYNPHNTVLAGRERVWIRGSYNRWRHPKQFGPIEMSPPTVGDHHVAAVPVPKDAYCIDFVFSDSAEGGTFDNKGGLDYHLPVEGSVVEEPPLNICHVAVEMAPICKVGGLGDVVTSLGRAVQEAGHQVEVILPRYDFFQHSPLLGATQYETEFDWAGTRIFVSTCVVEGLRCFFIEPKNGMFATNTVYQGPGDQGRFEFFSRAALEFLLRTQRQRDILHCHDWSTADVAKAYWTEYHNYGLYHPRVVFTIHNLDFGAAKIGEATYFSQRFTTVSPSYAWEIGGNPAVSANVGKLMGIRNGIDIDIWDPETDLFLPRPYTAGSVVEGKKAAREALRQRLGLTGWGDKPLVGVVSRLTKQKGTHLIAHSIWRTLDRGGQFVLLGSAPDPKVQAEFDGLARQYGGENAAFCFAFDEPLSHLIYAACDFVLVPSMFEPCGLTQMIAMRYGAVPVVRATGGLKDTVFDVDNDVARAAWELEGSTNPEDGADCVNGFSFEGTDGGAMDYGLNRALDAYYNDRDWFHGLQRRVMEQDWSWNKPAIDYLELYYAAMK